MNPRHLLLVALQLLVLAGLALSGPLVARQPLLLALEVCGFVLGMWAVGAVGLRYLRATPEPAAGAALVTRGPYRRVRHPMYSALLLVTLALVLDRPNAGRVAGWGVLLLVLVVKLRVEERVLGERFPGYAAYRARTRHLIPGVW